RCAPRRPAAPRALADSAFGPRAPGPGGRRPGGPWRTVSWPRAPVFGMTSPTSMRRYHLVTFGCQMNQHDSDRLRDVLGEAGYAPAEGIEAADLVLLNTCSVREKSEQKLRSEVGRIGLLKRQRPG